jgi:D-3-phosphoglycerate dehydrogenase
MKKVLLATEKPFAAEAVGLIKDIADKAGYQIVLLEKYTQKSDLLQAVADADAMIIRSDIVDAEVLGAAKQLKIVVRAGAGYDNIDLAAATSHNEYTRAKLECSGRVSYWNDDFSGTQAIQWKIWF